MITALVMLISATVGWLRGGSFVAVAKRRMGLLPVLRLQGMPVLLLGICANGLVMFANGGRMPVSLVAATVTGADTTRLVQGFEHRHAVLTQATRLALLGDVIGLPWRGGPVLSIGDLLIFVGLFFLVQDLMGTKVRLPSVRRTGQ